MLDLGFRGTRAVNGSVAPPMAALLGWLFPLTVLAQVQPPQLHPPVAGPIRPPIACNSEPAPQVTVTTNGIYVHLVWPVVPGARYYSVERLEQQQALSGPFWTGGAITPPLFPGIADPAGSSNLGFWDAVPDAGRVFSYKLSAVQANRCVGTTTTGTVGPLFPPKPTQAWGVHSQTAANVLWTATFGALAYRVTGPGIPAPWLEFKAGAFSLGSAPTVAPVGLGVNGGTFYAAMPNAPANAATYYVAAIYPNGISSDPIAAAMPAPPPPTQCGVWTFTPTSGVTGTVVSIQGQHFDSVTQVNLGPVGILPKAVTQSTNPTIPSSITIVVPDMSYYLLPQGFGITVHSKWGTCQAAAKFNVTLPTPVTVPNVVGESLQHASQDLQRAGLLLGLMSGPTLPTSQVWQQDRSPGAKVPRNTVVNVSTTANSGSTGAPGLNQVNLTNHLAIGEVYVWVYDYATGIYSPQDSNALGVNAQTSVTLPSGHFVIVYAVAPQMPQCGGRNDPSDTGSCVAWQADFFGGPSGAISVPMQ